MNNLRQKRRGSRRWLQRGVRPTESITVTKNGITITHHFAISWEECWERLLKSSRGKTPPLAHSKTAAKKRTRSTKGAPPS